MPETEQSKWRRAPWHRIGLGIAAAIVVLVLLEGLFSLGHGLIQTWRHAQAVPLAQRETDHDPKLGWVIEDGIDKRDFYGDWHPLTTHDAGHRVTEERSAEDQAGDKRLLCLGGSATFGVGVGDAQTWCARLGLASAAFVTVNAGQPGYGPDQAYLYYRYRVDAPHDVVLFTISGAALDRMFSAQHQGFPKPWFSFGDTGQLVVNNTPVPLRPYLWPWATANAARLSQVYLFKPWFVEVEAPEISGGDLANAVMLSNFLTRMGEMAQEREARLVVVYLPGPQDIRGGAHDNLRQFLPGILESGGVPFVDLGSAARALPPAQQSALFDAAGRLSAFGHQWAAATITEGLSDVEGLTGLSPDVAPWYARYYRDADFGEQAGAGWITQLSLDWAGAAPAPNLPADGFSAVFDACLTLAEETRARFRLEARGSAGLAINRQTVLETGEGGDILPRTNVVELAPGTHQLRVRFVDIEGNAAIRLLAQFDDGRVRPLGPARLHAPTVAPGGLVCSAAGG